MINSYKSLRKEFYMFKPEKGVFLFSLLSTSLFSIFPTLSISAYTLLNLKLKKNQKHLKISDHYA